MVAEVIAKGFLAFSHSTLIVPLLVLGFLLEKKGMIKNPRQNSVIWEYACLLILFSMIFNTFLKSLFLVPLNPAIGKEGFAFPSGHMQVSAAFYGWVFWAYPYRSIRGFILLVLTGIGYGLVQQGYHTVEDVIAAAAMGILTVYGMVKVTRLSFLRDNPAWLGPCLILAVGLMIGVIHYRIGISPHIIMVFMGFVGITVTWLWITYLVNKKKSGC